MVSYVLLISIVIGISIGVYAFVKDYASFNPKIDCKDGTSLSLEGFDNFDSSHPTNPNELILSLKNNGLFNVDGFFMRVSDDVGKTPTILINATTGNVDSGFHEFANAYKPGASTKDFGDVTFLKDGVDVKLIEIQPYIMDGIKRVFCVNSVIKQDVS